MSGVKNRSKGAVKLALGLVLVIESLALPNHLRLRSIPTGTLSYPLADNLDFREGTFECWVKIAFDPAEYLPAQEYQGLFTLVTLGGAGGAMTLHYCAQAGGKEPALWCSLAPKPKLTSFGVNVGVLKPFEWHHIALTWLGCEMELYFDGKKEGSIRQNDFIHRLLGAGAGSILIGDRWNLLALFTIDDLRISRLRRTPAELGYHGELQPDPYTSLLDNFECDFLPDGKQRTRPPVIFNGEGGVPSPQCRFVNGKYGKGLAFFTGGN